MAISGYGGCIRLPKSGIYISPRGWAFLKETKTVSFNLSWQYGGRPPVLCGELFCGLCYPQPPEAPKTMTPTTKTSTMKLDNSGVRDAAVSKARELTNRICRGQADSLASTVETKQITYPDGSKEEVLTLRVKTPAPRRLYWVWEYRYPYTNTSSYYATVDALALTYGSVCVTCYDATSPEDAIAQYLQAKKEGKTK